jgi:DNA processing protein
VSPYGKQVTEMLVQAVAQAGIVIISGLALGVDSIAHRSALAAQGSTIAVLPSGIEQIYPYSHRNLAKQIVTEGGTLVSEYTGADSPHKYQFIARNRLIAGLADAVLITEAAERSGSLHTAQFALEDGKDVLAVPGNITSKGSGGTNNLIKVGATPVTSAQDLLDYFNLGKIEQTVLTGGSAEEQAIFNLLQQGITEGSELLTQSQLSAAQFNQNLTMLEITGRVKPLGAGHWGLR